MVSINKVSTGGFEETRDGEVVGMANDHQPGLASDQIEVGQARLRADGG